MKGSSWGRGFAAALFFSVPVAQADVSFYAEGAFGFVSTADFEDTINSGYPFADTVMNVNTGSGTFNVAAPPLEADDYNVGGNIFVGMRFNQYIAAELMYLTYSEFDADFNKTLVQVDSSNVPVDALPVNLSGSMDVSGFGLGARLDFPLTDNLGIYGRAGMYEWRQKVSYSGNVISLLTSSTDIPTSELTTGTEKGFDLYGAVGAMLKVHRQTSVYMELNMADFGEDEFAMTAYGVFFGVHYDFYGTGFGPDQTANTKRASANDKRAVTACDPKYKDISGIACD
ncbi:MAG TPA: outer membrane beta-barrel protein [Dongiaceae bacterium]|nr:outer membrane beta-barrel protein [Dongiaceae bacterium]